MTTNRPIISARTLALLADPARLRRLRVAYRADPEVYADLLAVTALVLTCHDECPDGGTELFVNVAASAASEMSTSAAAQVLGISADAVRHAVRRGRLSARHRDGRWWIPTDAVARYRAA